jgi:hypothetical protein
MKKILVYFLLIIYTNLVLVPHLCEQDIYSNGTNKPVDEINSFYEQVMVYLGYDTTAEDEDGDMGTEDNSTALSLLVIHFSNNIQDFKKELYSFKESIFKLTYYLTEKFNLASIEYGIESPPPEV